MAERPEDLNLPNAVITRIIKEAIPDGVNISKEARLAISKAASVFVLYATSCSNNFAMKSKRKTIHAQDVLSAMQDMEFEQFLEPLKTCLDSFRHDQQGKKEACERRKKAKEEIVVCIDDEDEKENDDNHEDELMDGDDNSRDDDYIENNEVEEEEEEEEEEEDDDEESS